MILLAEPAAMADGRRDGPVDVGMQMWMADGVKGKEESPLVDVPLGDRKAESIVKWLGDRLNKCVAVASVIVQAL